LQVDLLVDGRPLTLFVNHFKSKLGGELETTPQRMAQAQLLADLSREMLAADPEAAVIVLGDFNDYFLSPPMQIMAGPDGPLVNVLAQIPEQERYSFIYNGASQLIDGLLLSPALVERTAQVAILHVNANYPFSYKQDITPAAMPFRSADHDLPLLILNWSGEEMLAAVEAGSRGWLIWLVVGVVGLTAVAIAVIWRIRFAN
jgi:predicted extracellular nuclease